MGASAANTKLCDFTTTNNDDFTPKKLLMISLVLLSHRTLLKPIPMKSTLIS